MSPSGCWASLWVYVLSHIYNAARGHVDRPNCLSLIGVANAKQYLSNFIGCFRLACFYKYPFSAICLNLITNIQFVIETDGLNFGGGQNPTRIGSLSFSHFFTNRLNCTFGCVLISTRVLADIGTSPMVGGGMSESSCPLSLLGFFITQPLARTCIWINFPYAACRCFDHKHSTFKKSIGSPRHRYLASDACASLFKKNRFFTGWDRLDWPWHLLIMPSSSWLCAYWGDIRRNKNRAGFYACPTHIPSSLPLPHRSQRFAFS